MRSDLRVPLPKNWPNRIRSAYTARFCGTAVNDKTGVARGPASQAYPRPGRTRRSRLGLDPRVRRGLPIQKYLAYFDSVS
jgi:hypothetical protein